MRPNCSGLHSILAFKNCLRAESGISFTHPVPVIGIMFRYATQHSTVQAPTLLLSSFTALDPPLNPVMVAQARTSFKGRIRSFELCSPAGIAGCGSSLFYLVPFHFTDFQRLALCVPHWDHRPASFLAGL